MFPSLEAVLKNFSLFYELLAKESIENNLCNFWFDKIHNNRMNLTMKLESAITTSNIKLLQRSEIAYDLDKVFDTFFARLANEKDDDLMMECFVESQKSRIADYSLEKITARALNNLSTNIDSGLTNLVDSKLKTAKGSDVDSSVFIVGPTGSGKTTFLRRFFNKTLSLSSRNNCLVLNIDCLDASIDKEDAIQWVTKLLINQIEKALYSESDGVLSFEDLKGLYFTEYQKHKKLYKTLYETDYNTFCTKFSDFLYREIKDDKDNYLRKLLFNTVHSRKKLPILVADNTDEFTLEFKKKLFQFCHALKREIKHCMIFFPVTDKSAWVFSKQDIFSIHQSRSFFLPTPPPKEVFRKRVDYLSGILEKEQKEQDKKRYLLDKGIKISISDINAFAKVIEEIFVHSEYTSKTLGELSNYNIRRTLILAQRVVTSPVIKIEDLIKAYVAGNSFSISFPKFLEALIKGDYEVFNSSDANLPEVYSLYSVSEKVVQSPLLKIRILELLKSAKDNNREIDDKHMSIASIVSYFDTLNVHETSVLNAIEKLLQVGLVEPYDLSFCNIANDQSITISYRGGCHLQLASRNSVYFFQMAITTPITCGNTAKKIQTLFKSTATFHEKIKQIKNIFVDYLITEDEKLISTCVKEDRYNNQSNLLLNIKKFKNTDDRSTDEVVNIFGKFYKQGVIAENVEVVVDGFDRERNFGFGYYVNGNEDRILFHMETLRKFNYTSINDGDIILCDIARGKKGIYVDKIHNISSRENDSISCTCTVTKYFDERGYGFCRIVKTGKDAWFHKTVFPTSSRNKLSDGLSFVAEIFDIQDEAHAVKFQVRKVLEIT